MMKLCLFVYILLHIVTLYLLLEFLRFIVKVKNVKYFIFVFSTIYANLHCLIQKNPGQTALHKVG
jgi:hypothetical protein